jgi:hypothetical protein
MTNNQNLNVVALQNLLAEHADALINGIRDRQHLLRKYQFSQHSYPDELMATAEQVFDAMPHVEPSDLFVAQLYQELVGMPATPFWGRWARRQMGRLPNWQVPSLNDLPVDVPNIPGFRQLPPRMQLAAAGLGGFLLVIAARAVLEGNGDAENHEETQLAADARTA